MYRAVHVFKSYADLGIREPYLKAWQPKSVFNIRAGIFSKQLISHLWLSGHT